MNLLFTGRGTSGSWQIRGEQLGRAAGAVVTRKPTLAQCKEADVIVVVKRIGDDVLSTIRQSGTPWVLDALDLYPQPASAAWSRSDAIRWVRERIKSLAPTSVIWPNQRMMDDCGDRGFVLRHHHRPGIKINPIREDVRIVAYEGSPAYIEAWRPAIDRECKRRGWMLAINPQHLANADIVLAIRGGKWSGYAAAHWKSGVKLSNAHASGTPFVGQRECGYLEQASGAEYWADTPEQLSRCFDWLIDQSAREQVADRFLQCAYPVESAADDLIRGLHEIS